VSARSRRARPIAVVTGGAGFVGTNVAHRLLSDGWRVRVVDDLSRPGVERNLAWLRATHDDGLEVELGDVRDAKLLHRTLERASAVFHFAAQVAVTSSLVDPLHDFAVNLLGTVTLLEEVRRLAEPPAVLFTSTNKVYGALDDLELVREGDRWEPLDSLVRASGIGEHRPLDFCTPYGCSKGGADQYVLDYAKSYDIPAVVFRMSCIYGPHQHGTEDQGWVAHFLLRALERRPITIYGDGAQVRDLLFVDDLVAAMLLAVAHADELSGLPFNIGGGSDNAVSLTEVLDAIAELEGRRPQIQLAPTRTGDQRYYVSDTSRFARATGWSPQVGVHQGLEALHAWLRPRSLVRAPG